MTDELQVRIRSVKAVVAMIVLLACSRQAWSEDAVEEVRRHPNLSSERQQSEQTQALRPRNTRALPENVRNMVLELPEFKPPFSAETTKNMLDEYYETRYVAAFTPRGGPKTSSPGRLKYYDYAEPIHFPIEPDTAWIVSMRSLLANFDVKFGYDYYFVYRIRLGDFVLEGKAAEELENGHFYQQIEWIADPKQRVLIDPRKTPGLRAELIHVKVEQDGSENVIEAKDAFQGCLITYRLERE